MKRQNFVLCVLAAALLFLFVVPAAQAQLMSGLWFKLNVKSSGYTVDAVTEKLTKGTFAATAYMHLTWNDAEVAYDFQIWTQDGSGIWAATYNDLFQTVGANEAIVSGLFTQISAGDTAFLGTVQSGLFTIKKDKAGALKSVSFKSMGCTALTGSLDGVNSYYGNCNFKASSVPESSLPF